MRAIFLPLTSVASPVSGRGIWDLVSKNYFPPPNTHDKYIATHTREYFCFFPRSSIHTRPRFYCHHRPNYFRDLSSWQQGLLYLSIQKPSKADSPPEAFSADALIAELTYMGVRVVSRAKKNPSLSILFGVAGVKQLWGTYEKALQHAGGRIGSPNTPQESPLACLWFCTL